ncbi:hypothetical protein PP175_26030 (plasmid) [Aneurinibacillus sp. Ricciae_BoGa-3]|uniref:hypothetical protein n=1 Tax=Aneurinibacillus sp. Ricciae_BoGa-3 TaxID=3022697 RepID=UPI0023427A24|nr:hypothetical protein [Aneurinibacillus sp. Ricciae_BoGa-3]WCK57526.1 hypothetical protein PP175_26030 [Aneurinibacillus sp. Ricciae_BoGa-3]
MSYFHSLKETKDVTIADGTVSKLGEKLRCLRKLGKYKIYVHQFMSVKNYYVLNEETNEIKYAGAWGFTELVRDLQEDEGESNPPVKKQKQPMNSYKFIFTDGTYTLQSGLTIVDAIERYDQFKSDLKKAIHEIVSVSQVSSENQ